MVDADTLAAAWHGHAADLHMDSRRGLRDAARAFMAGQSADVRPLAGVLDRVIRDGYAAGLCAARAATRDVLDVHKADGPPSTGIVIVTNGLPEALVLAVGTDWDTWEPGHPPAASLLTGTGLDDLLADYGIVGIKSLGDTSLTRLAAVLADSLNGGASVRMTADAIRGLLADESYAEMIAATETARAMTRASLDTYRANGVTGQAFWTAEDSRVCQRCDDNESQGEIPLSESFDNGDPPVHPDCRCTVAPVMLSDSDLSLSGLAAEDYE